MANESGKEGTGRHPHKNSREPWPHTKESGQQSQSGSGKAQAGAGTSGGSERSGGGGRSSGSERDGGGERGSERTSDLKEREYRDEKGEVHHHTRTYMERHEGKDGDGSNK